MFEKSKVSGGQCLRKAMFEEGKVSEGQCFRRAMFQRGHYKVLALTSACANSLS